MDQDKSKKSVATPVRLAEHFTASDKFRELFSYGMDLVEETATFLDTEGRLAAKTLSKPAMAVYGAESMRLTTRLMQLASWLLLQRAVAEGEMTVEQAITEKKNVKLSQLQSRRGGAGWDELPETFLDLVTRSTALQRRIKRLDDEIYGEQVNSNVEPENPVASQRALLETAFDRRFNR
jgi:regulator of CtrA degradation